MATVFEKTTDWITHGNSRVKIYIKADKSGSTITWTATPSAAQTLCYRHSYKDYVSHTTYYVIETYGENPISFCIKLDTGSSAASSASKNAIGTVNGGVQMSNTGWQSWTPTSEIVSASSSGEYTDVSIYILTNGTGGQKSTLVREKSSSGGGVTPSGGGGFLGVSAGKVGESWKNLTQGYVKVNGQWKPLTQGYVKVNGVWRPIS